MKRQTKGNIINLTSIFVAMIAAFLYFADFGETWNTAFKIIFFMGITGKWIAEIYLKPKKGKVCLEKQKQ